MNRFFYGSLLFLFLFSACQSTGDRDTLLTELSEQRRFISTDELADKLIQQDPSYLLVDVRSAEEFKAYSLPEAINIPLVNLLAPEEQERLNCEDYYIVFYANGTVLAEKAWVINRRLGCTNSGVLKGGLNEWTATILNPVEPPATASSQEWELYSRRKAANLYFSGGSKSLEAEPYFEPVKAPTPTAEKKSVPVQPKKVEVVEEEEEGC